MVILVYWWCQPVTVEQYHRHMGGGGVDKSDQFLAYHNVLWKTVRYRKTLFYCTINIVVVSSFIILLDSPIVRQLRGMIPEIVLCCKWSKNMLKSADNPAAQSDSSNLSSNKWWCQHCVLAGKGIRLTQRKCTYFSLHCIKPVGGTATPYGIHPLLIGWRTCLWFDEMFQLYKLHPNHRLFVVTATLREL